MPNKKAKNRQGVGEKTEGTISRRNVLKIGATAGAATVLAPTMLTSQTALGFQTVIAEPDPQCLPTVPATPSPAHTPFLDVFEAPFPAVDHPLSPHTTEHPNLNAGEADRAPHQRWAQFTPAHVTTEMDARPGLHQFHSDYGQTYVWGFNGRYPAPTVLNKYGKPTIVRFRNSLPTVTNTFGRNEITIHLHNGHHGSESDGFAGDFFGTGFWKDHLYPNCYAGLDEFGGNGDPREKMGTFWFHDHRAEFTLNNNVLGLNGMFIVYDKTDPGHEHPSNESLQLPGYYGVTDFPLILTDKRFCATQPNGRTEMVNQAGGDKFIVNGKIQPRLTVRRRKYRFRILSTGPTKSQWNLRLIDPNGSIATITVIATDANFLQNPIKIDAGANAANSNADHAPIVPGALRVNVAERYDVIFDFAQYPAGSKLYLTDSASQSVNPGNVNPPGLPPGVNIGNVVMRFDVVNTENWFPRDTPPIPETLCEYPPICEPDTTFEWQFVRDPVGTVPRLFKINNRVFDPDLPQHCVLKGTCEEWLLNNNVGGSAWAHPVHIHFEEFRTLKRFVNGVEIPVPALESGRKDVSKLEAGEGSLIRMKFRDYVGKYLIHCHNMGHEDAFMMVAWHIVPDAAAKAACDALIVQGRKEFEAKLRNEEVA
jgi:FtsP/CotA-like multicopper oxidase with cupredoxin domain